MKNKTKQTTVEWLVKQFEENRVTFFKLNENEERVITLAGKDVIEQAKEMDKRQHEETWENSRLEDKGDNYIGKQKSFDEYYNETYGGKK